MLTELEIKAQAERDKNTILHILQTVQRPGMDKLIEWLQTKSDYFIAPASTKYHGNYEGQLARHSLNVFGLLHEKNKRFDLGLSEDTIAITALLHDICKTNFYSLETCWTKGDNNRWQSYDGYKINDGMPLGHGEKSVIMIQNFIRLTLEEMLMIRWHMGNSEPSELQMQMNQAMDMYKSVIALHTADLEASRFLEDTIDRTVVYRHK
ncbi:HD domain-containing protein [Clostridium cellulovorans]|jgi:hypothetical protein|uniref:Metal-dependent phosphohydrolase HD sub domain n=1 Tax=Clostridium cellulovorans (strain ATCC 35296 / DSM 3052 / OCM 3 / 743B) TaxID=573061 RepID=D9SWF9_CLOC7|nr:HD domain-containing protein [Clostridium cellulovorans]ADL53241.1 metal-dependent phosphohydrolase HD sub domain [Clostridium cellulovorans 743B]